MFASSTVYQDQSGQACSIKEKEQRLVGSESE